MTIMTKRLLIYLFPLLFPLTLLAQDRKCTGEVVIPDEDFAKYESLYNQIRIYSCTSVEDAENFLKEFNEGKRGYDISAAYFKEKRKLGSDYKFEIMARGDGGGAVLMLCGDKMYKSEYYKVTKNTSRIRFTLKKISGGNTKGADGYSDWEKKGLEIENVDVTAKAKQGPKVKARSLDIDGYLQISLDASEFPLDYRENSRILVQPYWLDGPDMGDNKVFAYAKPVVLDMFEYDRTQIRRMNFDKEVYDSLSGYFVNDTTESQIIARHDTIIVTLKDTLSGYNPDESYPYPARVIICADDYNERYYIDTIHLDEGERTNYMRFLDFKYDKDFDVDIYEFKEEQQVSRMPSPPIEKQLNFNVGQATINYSDTMNTRLLRELEYAFLHLCDAEGTILKQMQVTGFASPEGNLESNKDLARRRAEFALGLVRNNLPSRFRNNIYPPKSEVRGWEEVEKMMRRDSLYAQADIVKNIIEANPGDITKQYNAIRSSGVYELIRERKYLDRLRSVRFDYVLLQARTKSPEEIRAEFELGLDETFNRAQYWELLHGIINLPDTVSDKLAMLERASVRALKNTRYTKDDNSIWGYKDTLYHEGYWPLAANIYASCLIAREESDINVLAPFINTDKQGDTIFVENLNIIAREEVEAGETPRIYKFTNNESMIANQIIMFISKSSRKYRTVLGDLVNLLTQGRDLMALPEKYQKLIALTNCSRGRWMEGADCSAEEAAQVRNIVASISTTNSVIINIAMADYKQDEIALNGALSMMDDLPENSAVSSYLKAILELMRKPVANKTKSAEYLADAFMLDLTKMPIANNDAQLIAPDQTKVINAAFEEWKKRTENIATVSVMRPLSAQDSLDIDGFKASGIWDESMLSDYMINTPDESHPYTWYKRATKHVAGKQSVEDIHADSLTLCLNKCIEYNPEYLSVIRVAQYVDNDVKNSQGRMLFEEFYLNESRKRK